MNSLSSHRNDLRTFNQLQALPTQQGFFLFVCFCSFRCWVYLSLHRFSSLSLSLLAPPRVQLASGLTHAKIGRRATLPRCNVTGYPVPVVTWRKLCVVLAMERAVYGEGSLTLVGARKTDTGLYQCRAKHPLHLQHWLFGLNQNLS